MYLPILAKCTSDDSSERSTFGVLRSRNTKLSVYVSEWVARQWEEALVLLGLAGAVAHYNQWLLGQGDTNVFSATFTNVYTKSTQSSSVIPMSFYMPLLP
jgi:hypothetical protein